MDVAFLAEILFCSLFLVPLICGGVIFWIGMLTTSPKMRFGRRSEKKLLCMDWNQLCLCDMSAESSLDANAETSVAKGMMQLTEGAWSMPRNYITDRHSNGPM